MDDRPNLSTDQQLALKTASRVLRGEFDGIFGEETIQLFLESSYDQFASQAKFPNFLPLMAERFARQRLKALAKVEGKATDGIFGEETIQLFLESSYDQFASQAKFPNFLPLMAERFARQRLKALAKVEGKATDGTPIVLFLCVHNAGRSQMALGWFNHLAGDRAIAWSGGSEPGAEVNPAAVEAMAEVGIDIAKEFPKPWTEEIIKAADVVVTMGCGDACPLYPGTRYEDWELEDPAGQGVEAVRPIRDDIRGRVEALLASLEVPASA